MWQRRYRGGKLKKTSQISLFPHGLQTDSYWISFPFPPKEMSAHWDEFDHHVFRCLNTKADQQQILASDRSWWSNIISMKDQNVIGSEGCISFKNRQFESKLFFSLFVLLFYESSTFSAQDGSRDEVQIRYAPTRMKYIQVYFKYTKFPFVEYWALT